MNITINRVTLLGEVCRDPIINFTKDNKKVAHIVVSTASFFINKESGEKKDIKEFHHVSIYIPYLINVVEGFVGRGSYVYLEGKLKYSKFIDASGKECIRQEIALQGNDCKFTTLNKENSPFKDIPLYNQ